jgi:hypothetical protein
VVVRASSAVALVVIVAPAIARADSATAQALFDQGRALMERGDYPAACDKLAASYRAEQALGTLLNLALCHERSGRTATAWLEYEDAVAAARLAHDDGRTQLASERAALLRPHVARVTIRTSAPIAGLVVSRDGVDLDPAALDTAIPIDPGDHEIRARAAGKLAWATTIHVVDDGAALAIAVPVLVDTPVIATAPAAPSPARRGRSSTAIALGAGGGAAVATGLAFGVVALSRWNAAKQHCMPQDPGLVCDSTGLSLSRTASIDATVSSIAIGAGLLAAGSAVVIHYLARREPRRDVAIVPVAASVA